MKTKLIFAGLLLAGITSLKSQSTSWNMNPVPVNGANNVGIGTAVLPMIITGDENTGIGNSALRNTQTGSFNTAAGMNGLMNNTVGDYNTALGHGADVGAGNLTNATAIGANAVVNANNSIQLGDVNVTQIFGGTGTNATFISGGLQITGGSPANGKVLTSNASGVATWQTPSLPSTGWSILGNAGTIDGTNFIGTTDNVPLNFRVNNLKAGKVDHINSCVFLGYRSGNISTGANNSAFGNEALYANTSGYGITASGSRALYSNISGYLNSAYGQNSLYANLTAGFNSAFGAYALMRNNTGGFNTSMGTESMIWNTTGAQNTNVGIWGMYNNSTGSNNTSIGCNALYSNTTGGNNTALGANSDVSAPNFGNATALGQGAIANANNKVVIGNTAVGMVIGGYAAWSNLSDGRFKENVKENVPGLDFIKKLRPVTYVINTKKLDEHIMQNMPDSVKAKRMQSLEEYAKSYTKIQTGFIAQEVEKTANDLGYNFDGVNAPKNPTDNYSIAYSQFIMPLVKAVQEQQQMIESLKEEIAIMKKTQTTDGNKTTSSIGQINDSNTGYGMEQNVPNPFTHETVIKYTLPTQVNYAYMGVYDLSGKQVTTFAITQRGSSSITITSEKLAAGMYFYSIVADGRIVDSKRMVVAEK